MTEIWSYLAQQPLLWQTATLAAFLIGQAIFQALGQRPLANPSLIAMVLLAVLLAITGTPFTTYFEGVQFVHFLLGPATVCLACRFTTTCPKCGRPRCLWWWRWLSDLSRASLPFWPSARLSACRR